MEETSIIQYVLTDGHGAYIRRDNFSGKYVPVRNEAFAEKFEQRHKAANILKNALSKNVRSHYYVVDLETTTVVNKEPISDPPKLASKDNIVKNIVAEKDAESQAEKWINGVAGLASFVMDAEERKEELVAQLSEVDKEITDINHYIEFGKFNAYQGWLAFSMLRSRLRRRRKIKDELRIIVELGQCKITSDMMIDINNAITELKNRKYAPRVLKQLFD